MAEQDIYNKQMVISPKLDYRVHIGQKRKEQILLGAVNWITLINYLIEFYPLISQSSIISTLQVKKPEPKRIN